MKDQSLDDSTGLQADETHERIRSPNTRISTSSVSRGAVFINSLLQTPHAPLEYRVVPASSDKSQQGAIGWLIELNVVGGDQAQTLRLKVIGDAVIGRSETADVDLDRFNAARMGVSRRHAVLRPMDSKLYLMELGSTNGTLLNEILIGPGTAAALRDGDILTLGDLRLIIRLANLTANANSRPELPVINIALGGFEQRKELPGLKPRLSDLQISSIHHPTEPRHSRPGYLRRLLAFLGIDSMIHRS